MKQVYLLNSGWGRPGYFLITLSLTLIIGIAGHINRATASSDAGTSSTNGSGVIAYATSDHEIWVMNADGTGARKLWEVPAHRRDDMSGVIRDLQWNKDGSRLVFSSGHEPLCSMYERNLYVISADGTGLQRVTNRPSCDELSDLPTGTVEFTLENQIGMLGDLLTVQVFVEGAPVPDTKTFLGLGTRTVVLTDVPDLGPGVEQSIVVVQGSNRWFSVPGVDVVAGTTVDAGTFAISNGNRAGSLVAFSPTWSPDGTELGFLLGIGATQRIAVDGGVLQRSVQLLNSNEQHAPATALAWSPVDNTVLFHASKVEGAGFGVYRATVGSDAPAELVIETDLARGLAWTPDGDGFVIANYYEDLGTPVQANIFHVDLAGTPTNLTNFDNEFAFYPGISPDGTQVIFTYAPDLNGSQPDQLRVVSITGGEIVSVGPEGAFIPAWGPGSVVAPPPVSPPPDNGTPPPPDNGTPPPPDNGTPPPPDNGTPPPARDPSPLYLPFL